VGPRVGLDERKLRTHRDSIPDRPTPSSVAIPTELPGPRNVIGYLFIFILRLSVEGYELLIVRKYDLSWCKQKEIRERFASVTTAN
jgi:hypothetical protein